MALNILKLNLQSDIEFEGLRGINRILALDSTFIELSEKCKDKFKGFGGSASKSGIKVQYCLDLFNSGILCIENDSAASSDLKFMSQGLEKNDLLLIDTGYVSLPNIKQVQDAEAFFLSPLRMSLKPLTLKGEKVQFHQILKRMKVGQIMDVSVLLGQKERLPMRMVIKRVPAEIAAERRRRMKRDPQTRHKNVSKERLALCDLEIFITNIPSELLATDDLRKIYALRWQVEICFKTWKSHFRIDQVPNVKLARFECFFWGNLVRIIISTNFFSLFKTLYWNKKKMELSELKTMKLLAQCNQEFRLCFVERKLSLQKLLGLLKDMIGKNCMKQMKKGKKTPFLIVSKLNAKSLN